MILIYLFVLYKTVKKYQVISKTLNILMNRTYYKGMKSIEPNLIHMCLNVKQEAQLSPAAVNYHRTMLLINWSGDFTTRLRLWFQWLSVCRETLISDFRSCVRTERLPGILRFLMVPQPRLIHGEYKLRFKPISIKLLSTRLDFEIDLANKMRKWSLSKYI